MTPERDPFRNPFAGADPDRAAIWEMLVQRDIDAFTSADWQMVAGDFIEAGFTGIDAKFQPRPEGFVLGFPTLRAYREEWLRQAQGFVQAVGRKEYDGDPRTGIYHVTTLEQIELHGDAALARKYFDGALKRSDGSSERMLWQTLYSCRRDEGRWKISGFLGYLPNGGGRDDKWHTGA